MALNRVNIPSPCVSSRYGSAVRLIVLHTAEGARTYQSLGSFFQNSANAVSSHVGIDDTPNIIGQYVKRPQAAWTQGNANSVAVSAELCAFAAWSNAEWRNNHMQMLKNCAAWIDEESKALGIPIVKLTPAQARGGGRGVCQHIDLGAWGGGHVDCGAGFPMDLVLQMAKGPAPAPPKPVYYYGGEDETMLVDFGDGDKADVGFPTGLSHLRLTSAYPGTVVVSWPKGDPAKVTVTVGTGERKDVAIPKSHNGEALLTRSGSEGPIYLTWVVPRS